MSVLIFYKMFKIKRHETKHFMPFYYFKYLFINFFTKKGIYSTQIQKAILAIQKIINCNLV